MRTATTEAREPGSTRWLYAWLLFVIFLEYARPLNFIPGGAALSIIYSAAPLGLLLMVLFSRGLVPWKDMFADPVVKWPFIFLGLVALSIFHANNNLNAYSITTVVLGYIFLFIILMRLLDSAARLWGVVATLAVAHLFLIVMNLQVITDPTQRHYIRGGTFLGDGNDFSMSLCILVPLVIGLALRAQKLLWKVSWFGVTAVLILAIIGTSSRGATLGLATVSLYLWLKTPRKLITGIVGAVVLVAVLAYAPANYFDRMKTITSYSTESSAAGRVSAWKAGTRMGLAHPVLGVGAGNFQGQFPRYRGDEAPTRWMTAHSSYFLVFAELGFTGLLVFLRLVFGNMVSNSRLFGTLGQGETNGQRSSLRAMLYLLNAGMLGFATAGAFLSATYYPHVLVLTALFVTARRLARTELAISGPAPAGPPWRRGRGREGIPRVELSGAVRAG